MSLSTTIKSIQDIMRKDAGVDGDAQRIGQLGWMLFFKIFSDLEIETELEDDNYESPVPPHLRWNAWANEDLVGTERADRRRPARPRRQLAVPGPQGPRRRRASPARPASGPSCCGACSRTPTTT